MIEELKYEQFNYKGHNPGGAGGLGNRILDNQEEQTNQDLKLNAIESKVKELIAWVNNREMLKFATQAAIDSNKAQKELVDFGEGTLEDLPKELKWLDKDDSIERNYIKKSDLIQIIRDKGYKPNVTEIINVEDLIKEFKL